MHAASKPQKQPVTARGDINPPKHRTQQQTHSNAITIASQ